MTADDMEDVDVATKAPESDAQEQKQEDSSVAAEQEHQKKPVTGVRTTVL